MRLGRSAGPDGSPEKKVIKSEEKACNYLKLCYTIPSE